MEWAALGMAIAACLVIAVIVAAVVSDWRDITQPVVPAWQVLTAFFATWIVTSGLSAAAVLL